MASKNILILHGHPDPSDGHLCDALGKAYGDGARSAGHDVTEIRLASLTYRVLRNQADFDAAPQDVFQPGIEALRACDHMVLVFPLWLGGVPSFTRGYLEQLFRPGVALSAPESGGFPKPLLKGKSARIIVTMGMPGFAYRYIYHAYAVRGLTRSMLGFSGMKPIRTSFIGMVDKLTERKAQAHFSTMHRLGARAI